MYDVCTTVNINNYNIQSIHCLPSHCFFKTAQVCLRASGSKPAVGSSRMTT